MKLLVAELLVTAQLFKLCLKPFPLEPILFSNSIHCHEPQFVSLFYSRFITFLGCSEKTEITDEDIENEELPDCCQVGTSRASFYRVMQVPQPLESLLPQTDLPVLNSIFLSPKTHHERFYSPPSFYSRLATIFLWRQTWESKGRKPETNTTPDNLQTETSTASNAPEMLPPPPEPLSLVSRDGLFYKGSDTTLSQGNTKRPSILAVLEWKSINNGIKEGRRKVGRKRVNSC